jgi:hypothetical protein
MNLDEEIAMTTLEALSRTNPVSRLGTALLSLALAGALVTGYRAAVNSTGAAVLTCLSHAAPASGAALLAAADVPRAERVR